MLKIDPTLITDPHGCDFPCRKINFGALLLRE